MTRLAAARLGYAAGRRDTYGTVFIHPLLMNRPPALYEFASAVPERRRVYLASRAVVYTHRGIRAYMNLGVLKTMWALTPQAVGMLAATGAVRRVA